MLPESTHKASELAAKGAFQLLASSKSMLKCRDKCKRHTQNTLSIHRATFNIHTDPPAHTLTQHRQSTHSTCTQSTQSTHIVHNTQHTVSVHTHAHTHTQGTAIHNTTQHTFLSSENNAGISSEVTLTRVLCSSRLLLNQRVLF